MNEKSLNPNLVWVGGRTSCLAYKARRVYVVCSTLRNSMLILLFSFLALSFITEQLTGEKKWKAMGLSWEENAKDLVDVKCGLIRVDGTRLSWSSLSSSLFYFIVSKTFWQQYCLLLSTALSERRRRRGKTEQATFLFFGLQLFREAM